MNQATINLVKHFEGLHDGDLSTIGLQPKLCPAGIWTEGYGRAMVDPRTKGHLRGAGNRALALKYSTIDTVEEAEKALTEDIVRLGSLPASRTLGAEAWAKLNDNQKGALASFVYNCGTHNQSTRKPYLIFQNIIKWLAKTMTSEQLIKYWETSVVIGGGKTLPGLVRRRKTEAALFFKKDTSVRV